MAASSRIFALDLGTQVVGLAEFKAGSDGSLVLSNYRSTELLADPAADATRHSQSRIAVSEMVTAMGYKGQSIHYAIASQSVFTRFVKLPSVGEEQVDQIVGFEAQQNVPYPINEVVWDYQLVETYDSAQVEVVIVAIKSDLLDDINDSVETSGLRTVVVDVSPMAQYNALRYNYADLPGCSLLVDIGARSTNLIFVEPKKVFSRSINTGGNAITAAIAKDFGEPFQAAEERKKRDGFVSLGGTYADPDDPDAARVSKIARNTMTRLHAEITRSISFYRSQQGGGQPARVFLAGGGASMPYMREFFQEKFQMPVEFFNPLRNVAVDSKLSLEELGRKAHTLGGLVGLALRKSASCPMELNLKPASVIRRQQATRQRPAYIVAALCLFAALAAWWQYYERSAVITTQVTDQLTAKANALKPFETNLSKVRSEIKTQEETAAPILTAIRERDYWANVLNDINSRLPGEYVWITDLSAETRAAEAPAASKQSGARKSNAAAPASETVVLISGLYLENPQGANVVDEFVNKLATSELYSVEKDKLQRTVPNENEWAYTYSFPLVLKNPISLGVGFASKRK